jgi:hypothetical protein
VAFVLVLFEAKYGAVDFFAGIVAEILARCLIAEVHLHAELGTEPPRSASVDRFSFVVHKDINLKIVVSLELPLSLFPEAIPIVLQTILSLNPFLLLSHHFGILFLLPSFFFSLPDSFGLLFLSSPGLLLLSPYPC